ncbi:hypothetical protein ACDA63_07325 [Uliginosibacterium sp. sgz301328]|uniref:hypothetical protein n=1 Tax=Uliginosibacterium sp. sgz301328 TaxID=3243764 RepID=UPI00359E3889
MSPTKRWLAALGGDAVFFGCLYLWQAYGMDGAGNIVAFMAWFFGVFGILFGFSNPSEVSSRTRGFATYHWISEILIVASLIWYGLVFAATAKALGALFVEAARNRALNGRNPGASQ